MRLLLIAMFSTEGGISKDFVEIAESLSTKCELYCVVNDSGLSCDVSGEAGRLVLKVGKRNKVGIINPKNYIRLSLFAKKHGIEKVYFYSHTPFNAGAIHALRGMDIYAFLHNPVPHLGTSWIKAKIEQFTNHYITQHAKLVFVASKTQAKELENNLFYKKYLEKIRVHYLGIQRTMLNDMDCNSEKDIDVLFFGRFEKYKGLDTLIGAMGNLPMIKCTIIGKGELGCDNLPECVTVINRYVPDDELKKYLCRCKIGCLPYKEATGTAIVQTFFSYSVPVIATNTGSLPEYVTDHYSGLIIEPNSIDQLKQAIVFLIKNDNIRIQYGKNARKELEKFDQEKLADELMEYFSER